MLQKWSKNDIYECKKIIIIPKYLNWVLNITLAKFVTIWRLFSSNKADILGGYLIEIT